jgi:hypothetical protein
MARVVIALLGTPIYTEEDRAAEAITPGHLIDFDASGNLVKHAGAGLNAAPMFALERDELGDDITTAYAASDIVKVGHFHKGQRVYALIASGQNISKGEYLESDGAGRLRDQTTDAATDDTQRVSTVARAIEAVDNSAGPGDARIRVIVV